MVQCNGTTICSQLFSTRPLDCSVQNVKFRLALLYKNLGVRSNNLMIPPHLLSLSYPSNLTPIPSLAADRK